MSMSANATFNSHLFPVIASVYAITKNFLNCDLTRSSITSEILLKEKNFSLFVGSTHIAFPGSGMLRPIEFPNG